MILVTVSGTSIIVLCTGTSCGCVPVGCPVIQACTGISLDRIYHLVNAVGPTQLWQCRRVARSCLEGMKRGTSCESARAANFTCAQSPGMTSIIGICRHSGSRPHWPDPVLGRDEARRGRAHW